MKVTLSFDNGPTETTAEVLDVLADRCINATFFVVGAQLTRPGAHALTERAKADGHWIGNHTMTHSVQFGDHNDPELPAREIGAAQDIIEPFAHPDKLFRPYAGGGVLDQRVFSTAAIDYLQQHRYTCVLWTSVPHDWDSPEEWVQRCLHDIDQQDWSVVVIHDLPTGAMRHLPAFLDQLDRLDAEIVQHFPDACVPIRSGALTADLSAMTTH